MHRMPNEWPADTERLKNTELENKSGLRAGYRAKGEMQPEAWKQSVQKSVKETEK